MGLALPVMAGQVEVTVNGVSAGNFATIKDALAVPAVTGSADNSQIVLNLTGNQTAVAGDPAIFRRNTVNVLSGDYTIQGNGNTITGVNDAFSILNNYDSAAAGAQPTISGARSLVLDNVTLTGGIKTAALGTSPGGGAVQMTGRYDNTVAIGTDPYLQRVNFGLTNNSILSQNAVTSAAGENAQVAVIGGGLHINGGNVVTLGVGGTGFTVSDNSATNGTTGANSSAIGGGIRLNNTNTLNVAGGTISGNRAVMTASANGTAHGGGVAIETGTDKDAVSTAGTFTGTAISGNIARHTGTAGGAARGGGVYLLNMENFNNRNGTQNTNITFDSVTLSGNQATATGNAIAQGGGVAMLGNSMAAFQNGTVAGNSASSVSGNAMGGGIAANNAFVNNGQTFAPLDTALAVSGTSFTSNTATSTSATAMGGAIYINMVPETITGTQHLGIFDFQNASFASNQAASTSGRAYGGAVYVSGATATFTDSTFTSNTAAASNANNAKGGAIFIDTASAQANAVTVAATAGHAALFSGNLAGGAANSLHFGTTTGTSNSASTLNINAAGATPTLAAGRVSLLDPIRAETTQNFTMNKIGTGELVWAGTNILTTTGAGAISTVNITEGTLVVADNFTLMGQNPATAQSNGNLTVALDSNATLRFNPTRDQTLAIFNFNNGGTKTFTVTNASIDIDMDRQITSIANRQYVVASGLSQAAATTAAGNLISLDPTYLTGFSAAETATGSGVYNVRGAVNYLSPYDYSGVNAFHAQGAVQALAWATGPTGNYLLSADQAAILRANPRSVTPELYSDMGMAFLDGVDTVARTALNYGVIQPHRSLNQQQWVRGSRYPTYSSYRANGALSEPSETRGFRLWAGYIGDFRNIDQTGSYNGYKIHRNGFLIGFNYDYGTLASVGFYGGYTYAKAKSKTVASENKADAGHFGFIGRLSPVPTLPDLSFHADVGYHFASNDTWRALGNQHTSGSYNQGVFTMGTGAEYALRFGNLSLIPNLRARLSYLNQDSMNETGLAATWVNLGAQTGLNTRLGVEATYDLKLGPVVVTPAVSLAWRHEFGSSRMESDAYFLQAPVPFTVVSSKFDRDTADIGLALKSRAHLGNKTLGLNFGYNLNLGKNTETHSLYAGIEIGF